MHLTLDDTQLSGRLQGHVFHLVNIHLVLLLNLLDFRIPITHDLVNGLGVPADQLLVSSLLLINLSLLVLHFLAVLFFGVADLIQVILLQLLEGLLKDLLLVLFLSLQSLEATGSEEHLLGILVSLLLDSILLSIDQLLALDLLGVDGFFDLTSERLFLIHSIGLLSNQLIPLLSNGVQLLLVVDGDLHFVVLLLGGSELVLHRLHLLLNLLDVHSLGQDLLRELELVGQILSTLWISILDVIDTKHAIGTNGEEMSVVGCHAHAGDWLGMGLDFTALLEWHLPHLDRAWQVLLADTSEEDAASVVDGQLRDLTVERGQLGLLH